MALGLDTVLLGSITMSRARVTNDMAIRVLSDTKAHITEANWIQNKVAVDGHGKSVHSTHPEACQWCLLAALERTIDKNLVSYCIVRLQDKLFTTMCQILETGLIVGGLANKFHSNTAMETVGKFNDHADTEYKDIINLLDFTINYLRAVEGVCEHV